MQKAKINMHYFIMRKGYVMYPFQYLEELSGLFELVAFLIF